MAADISPETIMAQAQALIEQAQQALDASDEIYRDLGLDPEKARAALHARLTPELHEQARQAFEKDRDQVEDRFREELARAGLNTPAKSTKPARRARFMV